MKRLAVLLLTTILALLCACGAAGRDDAAETPAVTAGAAPAAAESPEPAPASEPTPPPLPAETAAALPELPSPAEGWEDAYLSFLDDNYDILAALWPEGLAGVGFIDLDLDGTPEMILFDQGASATLGAQMFDWIDGRVYCVSSVLDSAKGAFDGAYFSPVSVCTSYFEAFRLSLTEEGYAFWVTSANGTMEASWDELIRFGGADGVLTPEIVCSRELETDPEAGVVVEERYTVGGETADAAAYAAAAARYTAAADTGYEAKGVFLWNDMQSYDTTYDGLMAMARDAVSAYRPIR